jgi:ABC-type multidrug transport system fused ATPase/permease subunit
MKLPLRADRSAPTSSPASNGKPPSRWRVWTSTGEDQLKALDAVRSAHRYLKPYRSRFVLMAVIALAGTTAEALVYIILGRVVNVFNGKSQLDRLPVVGRWLIELSTGRLLLIGIGLVAVRFLCFTTNAMIASRLSAHFEYTHRRAMIEGFLSARWDVQSTQRGGSFQSMLGWDLEAVRSMIDLTSKALPAAIGFVVMLVAALLVNPYVALLVIASTVMITLLLRPISLVARSLSRRRGEVSELWNDEVQQMISLAREVQVFGISDFVRRSTDVHLSEARRLRVRSDFLSASVMIAFQNSVLLLAMLALGGVYLVGGESRGTIAPIALLLIRSLSYSQTLQAILYTFIEREPYVRRLEERRAIFTRSARTWGTRRLDAVRAIEFDDVTFAYGSNPPALRNISFSVGHGEAVAIVGPSGAGKSTLIQLLLGLFLPGSGSIRVNGAAIHDHEEQEWARSVAYVSQEPILLRTSIAENIRFGREGIDQEAIERAARLAYIAEDIERLPNGYEELAGERGARLSGGQRQRITIARALAADPKILVFDEPTSALDLVSEYAIRQTLEELHGKVNLFIISHRPATLDLCDRVIVLNEGTLETFAPLEAAALESKFVRHAGVS